MLKILYAWSKCIIAIIFILGFGILLLYLDNFSFHKSFTFLHSVVKDSKSFNLALNITSNSTLPTLCIVTRIYQAQISYFPVLALGLYHTGLHNIRIYIINTDNRTDIEQLKQTIKFVNELVLRKDFIIYLDLGEPSIEKDFGYGMTDRAITYLYKQHVHSPSICQYVTFTNGDNFYSRNFARKILPYMKAEKDIIAWSFVSHHSKPQYRESIKTKNKPVSEIVDDGTEKCTPAILQSGYTDLGAVAYRLSFLQKHNLYFLRSGRADPSRFDGYFVDEATKRTSASLLLRQTLFVHQ